MRDSPFRLLHFRVEPEQNLLCNGEEVFRITPRTMQVLLALASSAGKVMSRDEIFDQVWGDVIVGAEALTRCIVDLRKALRDTPSQPRFIRTVPRQGYCLLPCPEPVPVKDGRSWWRSKIVSSSIRRWWAYGAMATLVIVVLLAARCSRL